MDMYTLDTLLLSHDLIMYNSEPPGHLGAQRRVWEARPVWASTNPPFFSWVWVCVGVCSCGADRSTDMGSLPLCPWHRTHTDLKLPLKGERPDAAIIRVERNICAGKVLSCSAFLFIIIITQWEKKHDIISCYLRLWLHLHLLFMQRQCALRAMHSSITKLAWRISNHLNQASGNFT